MVLENIEEYCADYSVKLQQLYDDVLVFAKTKLEDGDNIIDFLIEAMKKVCTFTEIHGYEKKELVLDVVRKVIDIMTIKDDEKDRLRKNVAPFLDHIVDLMIASAKGYLFLEKVSDKAEEYADDIAKSGCCGPFKPKKKLNNKKLKQLPTERGVNGLVDLVYDKIKSMISNRKVTVSNIVTIVTLCMQIVQQYPSLEGAEKKEVVKQVVYRIVEETNLSEEDKLSLKVFLDATLDKTIDFVIKVANGEIDIIGKVEEIVTRCTAMCNK